LFSKKKKKKKKKKKMNFNVHCRFAGGLQGAKHVVLTLRGTRSANHSTTNQFSTEKHSKTGQFWIKAAAPLGICAA
jgi:hypothetical protein